MATEATRTQMENFMKAGPNSLRSSKNMAIRDKSYSYISAARHKMQVYSSIFLLSISLRYQKLLIQKSLQSSKFLLMCASRILASANLLVSVLRKAGEQFWVCGGYSLSLRAQRSNLSLDGPKRGLLHRFAHIRKDAKQPQRCPSCIPCPYPLMPSPFNLAGG